MGGCCCSSRQSHLHGTPVYYFCPPTLEERQTLRSYHGAASSISAGFLVGLNLDTSSPDTYRPPPTPIPFNVLFGRPQTPVGPRRSPGTKFDPAGQSTESAPVAETAVALSHGTSGSPDCIKKSDSKTLADILLASPTKSDVDPSNPNEPDKLASEEEDVCPICLEEYDAENPKMITNCEHDFHLSCILDWMERSDSCPVCDKEMIFDPPDD